MMREITFDVNGVTHIIAVLDEEDARAKLRTKLQVARLPRGVQTVGNREVEFSELSRNLQETILADEKGRLARMQKFYSANPDMGNGWKNSIANMECEIAAYTKVLNA